LLARLRLGTGIEELFRTRRQAGQYCLDV
jgi:hypothetical protein